LRNFCVIEREQRGDPGAWGRKTATSNDNESGMPIGDTDSIASLIGTKTQTTSTPAPTTGRQLKTSPSLVLDWDSSVDLLPEPEADPIFHRRVMENLSQVIGEETGFLLESKLRKMLGPLLYIS